MEPNYPLYVLPGQTPSDCSVFGTADEPAITVFASGADVEFFDACSNYDTAAWFLLQVL